MNMQRIGTAKRPDGTTWSINRSACGRYKARPGVSQSSGIEGSHKNLAECLSMFDLTNYQGVPHGTFPGVCLNRNPFA